MSILPSMDYWHEIVKSYDDPKRKDPKKKDDGTYSQSSVVILLMYLTYGADHPFHIKSYFSNLFYKPLDPHVEIPYSSNLCTTKIYTLLNRMKEDELVTVFKHVVDGRPRKTYSINPRIIQSPIKSGTYIKRDGSTFEIPLEKVEQFLPWRDLQWKENKDWSGRDGFFRHVVYPDTIDFLLFIQFLQSSAHEQNLDIESNRACFYNPSLFEKLLEEYYEEIENYYKEMDESKNLAQNYVNPFKKTKKETKPG
jgi:hypothetical protein